MAYNNADIELLAGLNINSSEAEILRAIRVLEQRIRKNSGAKITLDATFDNAELQSAIEKLQKLLQSKDLSIDTKNSIKAITQEATAMLEVVDAAKKASDEKLEFADANRRVRESAETTADAIDREHMAMENMEDIDYILSNINMNGQHGQSVFQQFGDTLRNAFYAYTAANLLQDAIHEIVDAGQEGVETVKELNDALTSLRMATGQSYESVKELLGAYNELGQELGAITVDVSESADEWLRQGHSINDTNELIKDSMMLSKISNLESAESTKYLTSAMQGYRVAAEDVVRIVDKLSAVDLESATDAGGLAEAMSRTAEGARIAGVSMDRLLGMIATVGEVTQKSMSSIGEAYKTTFSRMRDIKDNKLSIIGDDGEIEDISNVEIVLESLGIKLRDSNLEFRNFQEVLDDVGESWDKYTSVQKAAIAKAFSGTRQQENFLVMMENWDKVVEYTEVAANSAGTAEEKFGYYLESLEAKTNSLKASLENLASVTISDELYASVLDTTKSIVDMTAETGILKGALAGLGIAGAIYTFQNLATYLRNATQEFANLGEAMQITRGANGTISDIQRLIDLTGGLSQSQTRLLLSTNNLTDAQKVAILMNQGLTQEEAEQTIVTWGVAAAQQGAAGATITWNNALRGLWATLMANPLILVTVAVTAAATAFNKYKQSQEEAIRSTKQSAEESAELSDELSDLVSKYISLSDAVKDDESAKADLLDVQNDLIEKLGLEADNLDTLIEKYGSLDEAIKNATLSKLDEARHDLVSGYDVAVDELLDAGADKIYKNQWTVYSKQNKEALEILNKKGIGRVTDDYIGDTFYLTGIDSTVEGVLKNYEQLGDALSALEEAYGAENVTDIGLYNDLYTRYNELKGFIESYQDSVDELNENAASALRLTMLKEVEFPDTSDEIEDFKQGMLEAALVSKNFIGTQEDIERAVNSVMNAFTSYSGAESILGTVTDMDSDLKLAMFDKQSEAYENYKSLISDISKVYADYENLSKTDIMNMFSDSGYDFTNFMKGTESLNVTMQKLADQGLKSVTNAFKDMEGAEQILHDLEQSALGLASNAFGWSENVGHINKLENLLAEIQKGEPLEQQIVDEIRKNYKLNAISLDGGFTFDEEAVQDLLNDFSEDYNESLAKFRVFMRDVMGFSEEGINNFFGKYVYRIIPDSNSGSEKNSIKDFSESIDWASQTVSNLKENLSDLETTLDNTKGWEDQKQAIDDVIDAQEKLKGAYEQSKIMYSSKYQSSLRNGVIAEQGLTNAIREKIESNELFAIEPFIDEVIPEGADEVTKERLYNAIQEAIDWYNKKNDAENNAIQIGFEIDANELEKLNINADHFSSVRDKIETALDASLSDASKIALYKDLEQAITDDYNAQIAVATAEKDTLEVEKLQLQMKQDLAELDQNRLDIVRAQTEAEISQLEHQRNSIQNQINLNGGKGTTEQYQTLINNEESIYTKRKAEYERENRLLTQIEQTLGENSDEYREQLERIRDCEDGLADCEKNTKEWGKAILELAIDEINNAIDNLNEKLQANQDKQDEMDSIIAGAVAYIQDEIDAQEELKQGIQDQIDALNEANDERERALALEKAKYELERAMNQRTVNVYKGEGKGYIYEQNQDDVRAAQENLSNLEFEETIHALEKQKEYYDDIISDLQEMQDAWNNIKSDAEDYLNIEKALNEIGVEGIFDTAKVEEYSVSMRGLLQTEQQINDEIKTWEAFLATVDEVVSKYDWGALSFKEAANAIDEAGEKYLTVLDEFQLRDENGMLTGEHDQKKVAEVLDKIKNTYFPEYISAAEAAGEEAGDGIVDPVQEALDKTTKATKDANDARELDTKDTNDAIELDSKTTYETITSNLNTELGKQKIATATFKGEMIQLFSELRQAIVFHVNTAFSQMDSKMVNVAKSISSKIQDIIDEVNSSIEDLEESVEETKELANEVSGISDSIGGGKHDFTVVQFEKHHTGLENGLVGEKDAGEGIKRIGLRKLEPDEIPEILQVGEAVLTKLQQQNVMSNFGAAFKAGTAATNNFIPVNRAVNIDVGGIDINCPGVTSQQVAKQIQDELWKQFGNLSLDALQYANRR